MFAKSATAKPKITFYQLAELSPTATLDVQLKRHGLPGYTSAYTLAFCRVPGEQISIGHWHGKTASFAHCSANEVVSTIHYFNEFPEYLENAIEESESNGLADRDTILEFIAEVAK